MTVPTYTGNDAAAPTTISDDDKVDIRRYTGYPAYGTSTTAFFEVGGFLWNFNQLELRMNNMSISEVVRVRYFLSNLRQIEQDLMDMRDAMIVDQAAVFKRNQNEPGDRHGEYRWWLRHLVHFLGIQPGPQFEGGQSGNSFRFIK